MNTNQAEQREPDEAGVKKEGVPLEIAKLMAEALKATWDELEMGYIVATGQPSECGECGSIGKHSIHCFQGKIEPALSAARQFGLLDDSTTT